MLVPSRYFLVLEYYSIVTLMDSIYLVDGGGDLLLQCFGDLGWPEGDGYLRSDLGSGEIAVSS